jgi:small conductance mechanosensitive channel
MLDTFLQAIGSFFDLYLVPLGWKLIGAVVVWVIGGWLIGLAKRLVGRNLSNRKVDATLVRYADGAMNIILRILLVVAVFGILGIETTSFAALLAAIGIAIGAAWAGLLANFAAGVFLIFLRPFKVGDVITAGEVTGTVREIGMFVTAIDTPDNVLVYVGNNAVFSGTIQNYSANPYRRVDLIAQLAHDADPSEAAARLKARLAQVPNVLADPAPVVEILTFNEFGAVLAVRPSCHNDHYAQVFFDTNKVIAEVGAEGKFGSPEKRVAVRNVS